MCHAIVTRPQRHCVEKFATPSEGGDPNSRRRRSKELLVSLSADVSSCERVTDHPAISSSLVSKRVGEDHVAQLVEITVDQWLNRRVAAYAKREQQGEIITMFRSDEGAVEHKKNSRIRGTRTHHGEKPGENRPDTKTSNTQGDRCLVLTALDVFHPGIHTQKTSVRQKSTKLSENTSNTYVSTLGTMPVQNSRSGRKDRKSKSSTALRGCMLQKRIGQLSRFIKPPPEISRHAKPSSPTVFNSSNRLFNCEFGEHG
ncbi:hypothetical protein BDV93DRAFT_513492 [Ceratobasidium sp. AG-I]|nr:hypothetical protein BDV93DRAFT_513492 [Ceratobasidium sp. AG-I]